MMNTLPDVGFPPFFGGPCFEASFKRARNGQQLSPEAASSAGNKRKAIEASVLGWASQGPGAFLVPKKGFRQ